MSATLESDRDAIALIVADLPSTERALYQDFYCRFALFLNFSKAPAVVALAMASVMVEAQIHPDQFGLPR